MEGLANGFQIVDITYPEFHLASDTSDPLGLTCPTAEEVNDLFASGDVVGALNLLAGLPTGTIVVVGVPEGMSVGRGIPDVHATYTVVPAGRYGYAVEDREEWSFPIRVYSRALELGSSSAEELVEGLGHDEEVERHASAREIVRRMSECVDDELAALVHGEEVMSIGGESVSSPVSGLDLTYGGILTQELVLHLGLRPQLRQETHAALASGVAIADTGHEGVSHGYVNWVIRALLSLT